jgi:toxin ParE1/3/4
VAHKVFFLRRAENRLAELGVYIASEAGLSVADGYLDRIYSACMALAEFPERGRKRDDILPGLRTITMERRVTIAYRVLRSRVEIVTIGYAGRDFAGELRKRK